MNDEKYSPLNPAALFMIQRRQRIFQRIFSSSFPDGLADVSLLEIGCGNGQWLAEFQTFGLRVDNCAGIELDPSRAEEAIKRIQGADIRQGNANELPWPDESFDVVFQSTVFTSILDVELQQIIANEMKRVCRPNGMILWYDFTCDNPKNLNVKGVSKNRIKELFSPWNCQFRSCTLVPPLARSIIPASWLAAEFIETLFPFSRTHLIVTITS